MKPEDQARVDLYEKLVKEGRKKEAAGLCQISMDHMSLKVELPKRLKRNMMGIDEARIRMKADLARGRNVNGYDPEKSNDYSESTQEPSQ